VSSIINKSKWIVTVKRRPDPTRALGTLEQHIKDGVLPKFSPVHNGRLLYLREDDYFAAINASLPRTQPSVAAKPGDLAPGTPHSTPSPTLRVGVRLDLLKSAPAELL
jgi:hypothetical protein